MRILIYCPDPNQPWRETVSQSLPAAEVIAARTLPGFLDILGRPLVPGVHMALIYPADKGELARLVEQKGFLEGIDTIIVMPPHLDREHALAHQLAPRMVFTRDSLPEILPGALRGMAAKKLKTWGVA